MTNLSHQKKKKKKMLLRLFVIFICCCNFNFSKLTRLRDRGRKSHKMCVTSWRSVFCAAKKCHAPCPIKAGRHAAMARKRVYNLFSLYLSPCLISIRCFLCSPRCPSLPIANFSNRIIHHNFATCYIFLFL